MITPEQLTPYLNSSLRMRVEQEYNPGQYYNLEVAGFRNDHRVTVFLKWEDTNGTGEFELEECQPLFKPMSDITNAQAKKFGYCDVSDLKWDVTKRKVKLYIWEWLLSQRYDVFNIIKTGDALNENDY